MVVGAASIAVVVLLVGVGPVVGAASMGLTHAVFAHEISMVFALPVEILTPIPALKDRIRPCLQRVRRTFRVSPSQKNLSTSAPRMINDDTNEEEKLHVLNCFGYTGGSTLAALGTANVNVTHVDASRTFVNWCKRNVDASGIISNLPDMRLYKEEEDSSDDNNKKDQGPPSRCRFLVDDTLSFLKREVRRGKKYNGIILDPPAFGRGPKTKGQSKTWKIDRDLPELIDLLPQPIHPRKPGFLLLTNHDEAFPPNTVVNMLRRAKLPKRGVYESGNMVLRSEVGGEDLPMGSFVRISWLAGR